MSSVGTANIERVRICIDPTDLLHCENLSMTGLKSGPTIIWSSLQLFIAFDSIDSKKEGYNFFIGHYQI